MREIEEKLRRNYCHFMFFLSCAEIAGYLPVPFHFHVTMRLLLQACKTGTFYFLSHLVTLSADRQYEMRNPSAVNSFLTESDETSFSILI